MSDRESNEPPLEIQPAVTREEDSTEFSISRLERSLTGTLDVQQFSSTRRNDPLKQHARPILRGLINELRSSLADKNVPANKSEVRSIELDAGHVLEERMVVQDDGLSIDYVNDDTSPNTEPRISANYLHALIRIERSQTDEQLEDTLRAMGLHHQHKMMNGLNALAITGDRANRGRAAGPIARKERSASAEAVILDLAQEYWDRLPNHAGRTTITAKRIADNVNSALLANNPNAQPLTDATIEAKLRAAMKKVGWMTRRKGDFQNRKP